MTLTKTEGEAMFAAIEKHLPQYAAHARAKAGDTMPFADMFASLFRDRK